MRVDGLHERRSRRNTRDCRDVGMSAWMALTYFVFFPAPHPKASDPIFWFVMQIAMVIGYRT